MLYFIKRLCARLTISTVSQARRAVKIVMGFTLLGVGLALTVLPGPAFIVIPLGVAVLAGEFVWARKLFARFNSGLRYILYNNKGKKKAGRSRKA